MDEFETLSRIDMIRLHIGVATPGPLTHCIAIAIVGGMSAMLEPGRAASVHRIARHINRNPQWVGRVMRMLEADGFVQQLYEPAPGYPYPLWGLTEKAMSWLDKSGVVVFSTENGRVFRYADCA